MIRKKARKRKDLNEDEKTYKTMLNELSRLLIGSSEIIKEPDEHKYLYRACCTVWDSMGISYDHLETWDLKREAINQESCGVEERVKKICVRAKVQFQKVYLENFWWTRDGGSMLGFLGDVDHPVTLERHMDSYFIIDNIRGTSEKVTASNAQMLLPNCYVFYPTWKSKKFSIFSMQKVLLKGLHTPILSLLWYLLLSVLLGTLFPIANKVFFDDVIPNIDLSLYLQLILGLTGVGLALFLFSYISSLLFLQIEGFMTMRQNAILWDHLFKMPSRFFHEFTTGDLLQRMAITDKMKQLINQGTLKVTISGIIGIAYIFPMAYLSPSFAFFIFLFAMFIMVLVALTMPYLYRLNLKIMRLASKLNTTELEIFSNVGQLRLFQAEKRAFAYWSKTFLSSERNRKKLGNVNAIIEATSSTLSYIFYLIFFFCFYIFMFSNTESTMSIGTFISFQSALVLFSAAFTSIITTSISYTNLYAFWQRIKSTWTEIPELAPSGTMKIKIKGNITVSNVTFSYEPSGHEWISNLSFNVTQGEFLAIKGPSGCGKSTLLRLLSNIEKPNSGHIQYEGIGLNDIDPECFKQQVGSILQTSRVITGSVQDNILCGREGRLEQVLEALRVSKFDEIIKDFPMGLQTLLITGGKLLSTGQAQRLLLARALLTEPKVLLLDEATSGIFIEAQKEIFTLLKEKGVTIIFVTHDEMILSFADRVISLYQS